MKQKELSVWLRIIAVLGSVCIIFLAVFVAPDMTAAIALEYPQHAALHRACLIFFWITVLPVLAVAVLAWLIAKDIGRDNSFCMANARRLRLACIMAVTDTALYFLGSVTLALFGVIHPAVMLRIFFICAIGAACAVVFAALSHLTRKAAELKSENDMTI